MKKIMIYILALLMLFNVVPVQTAFAEAPAVEVTESDENAADEALEALEELAVEEQPDVRVDLAVDEEQPEAADEPAENKVEQLAIAYDYDHLVVGSATPFDGKFFTQMWGNATTDLDVRMLVHGYNLVEWYSAESTFRIDPSVVSSIIVTDSPAGDRTYSLTLYHDLYYNDGTPITAWDYAFSMLLNIAPQITEIGGSTRPMEYIQGYNAYVNGRANTLAGVRVLNDYMISITIDHNYLPFFYEMGMLDCTPYPIAVIAPGCRVRDDGQGVYIANTVGYGASAFTTDLLRSTILDENTGYMSHPGVTSGPYTLTSFDGTTAELELNPYYKGNSMGARPTIRNITYRVVGKDEMMDLFAAGKVMLLNKVTDAKLVQEGIALTAQSDTFAAPSLYPRVGLGYLAFCCERDTVNTAAVRQAISMCVDKDALVQSTVSSYGIRVDGYYGLGQWMYQLASGTLTYPVREPVNATAAERAAYEAEVNGWANLTLDDIKVYDFDTAAAVQMLESNGWTLNRQGNAYNAQTDDVRCKLVNGQLVALDLKMLVTEENHFADALREVVGKTLAEAGIGLTVEEMPMQEVLRYYYRQAERDCDMIFMASNFDVVFDPSVNFRPDSKDVNHYNTTAIQDPTLYALALDMRQTAPGDALKYVQKWVAFQKEFQEEVPMIPLYSNVYFDFYPRVLQNYNVSSNVSWGKAIVDAYMSDVH